MNHKHRFSLTPWVAAALVALTSNAFAQPGPGAGTPGAGPGAGMPDGPMMMHARHGGGMHGGPGMGMQGRGMRGNMIERLLAAGDELKLTDAQRDKLRQIRRSGPAALMPKRQAMMEAQMDLRDVMDKDKADAAELRRAHDKVLKARTDMAAATFELRVQVREVLTPEQRQMIRDHMRGAGRERMQMRMKKGGPGGPGGGFLEGDDEDDAGDDGDGEF